MAVNHLYNQKHYWYLTQQKIFECSPIQHTVLGIHDIKQPSPPQTDKAHCLDRENEM